MIQDEWFFRIKTATRTLVKLVGTHEAAGLIAGVSKSQMHRWASPTDPEIITLTAAMKLEAESGMACITEVMASRLGHHLRRADGTPVPGCMLTAFAGVAEASGEVAGSVAAALQDGVISPNEHTAICDEADRLIVAANTMKGVSAKLRAVEEPGRAA